MLKLKEEQRMRKRVVGAGIRNAPARYDASVLGSGSRAAAATAVGNAGGVASIEPKQEPMDEDDSDEGDSKARVAAGGGARASRTVAEASKADAKARNVQPATFLPHHERDVDSDAACQAGGWLDRHESERYRQEAFVGLKSVIASLSLDDDDDE